MNETALDAAESSLVEDGFAVVSQALGEGDLKAIQAESAALIEHLGGADELDTLVRQFGCVVEPMREVQSCEIRAQTSTQSSYQTLRAAQLRYSDPMGISDSVCNMIFDPSRRGLRLLLERVLGQQYYLYNEQHIIKPPSTDVASSTEFSWHKDSERAQTQDAFVSCWVALDDVDTQNGGLRFRGYSSPEPVDISMRKGDVVLIAHDVYHSSVANLSSKVRPAYMAQFSQVPMKKDGELIAFAVPQEINC